MGDQPEEWSECFGPATHSGVWQLRDSLDMVAQTPADINGDGVVDQTDRDILDTNMGQTQLWP